MLTLGAYRVLHTHCKHYRCLWSRILIHVCACARITCANVETTATTMTTPAKQAQICRGREMEKQVQFPMNRVYLYVSSGSTSIAQAVAWSLVREISGEFIWKPTRDSMQLSRSQKKNLICISSLSISYWKYLLICI